MTDVEAFNWIIWRARERRELHRLHSVEKSRDGKAWYVRLRHPQTTVAITEVLTEKEIERAARQQAEQGDDPIY